MIYIWKKRILNNVTEGSMTKAFEPPTLRSISATRLNVEGLRRSVFTSTLQT